MKVYVNAAFLVNLFLAEEETDRHFYIKRLLSGRQSGVDVILDMDIEEIYNDDSSPEKQYIKASARQIAQNISGSDPTFPTNCQQQAFHESGEAKLFFVDGICLAVVQQYGCLYASTNRLEDTDFLFYAEELRINNSQRDWSILGKIKHPCNALVLTDNYLLSNDANLENIKSICSNIMPDSLDAGFKFDVTIIGHHKDHPPIEKQHVALDTYFKAKFPYPVNLTIIREGYHDRYIFTNYYRITSGKGFALFKNGRVSANDETTLTCKSVAYEGRLSSNQAREDELLKCSKINQVERVKERLAGNRINRLL